MLTEKTISIIVPIYKGEKYLERIISQISLAKDEVKKYGCKVELVLVNDYPEKMIDSDEAVFEGADYEINIINSSVNQGIHGARTLGIRKCKGDYVVLLDQDDYIFPEYLESQLNSIGDCEAVVCRLIHEGRVFYNEEYPFDAAMNMEYMLNNGCPIVSPGQVMIKKSSFPSLWLENRMVHNGADDFLLWLSFLSAGGTFALNGEVVFEHTIEYDNNSWNSVDMIESEREMIDILRKDSRFAKEYKVALDSLEKRLFTRRINQLDKFKKMFFIYDGIMKAKYQGVTVADYLNKQNYTKVAVFGYGYVGKFLVRELESSGITVEYIIDRNADYMTENRCFYKIEDSLPKTDCIIISLVQNEEPVLERLKEKCDAQIIAVKKLLINMLGKEENAT